MYILNIFVGKEGGGKRGAESCLSILYIIYILTIFVGKEGGDVKEGS